MNGIEPHQLVSIENEESEGAYQQCSTSDVKILERPGALERREVEWLVLRPQTSDSRENFGAFRVTSITVLTPDIALAEARAHQGFTAIAVVSLNGHCNTSAALDIGLENDSLS